MLALGTKFKRKPHLASGNNKYYEYTILKYYAEDETYVLKYICKKPGCTAACTSQVGPFTKEHIVSTYDIIEVEEEII